jgi:endoglucanase
MKIAAVLLGLLILALPPRASGQAPREGVPDERMALLSRGVNLGGWFVPGPDGAYGGLGHEITREDLHLIRSLGFRHVRLAIDPAPLWDAEAGRLRPEPLATLEEALRAIGEQGLAVVVDIHPGELVKPAIIGTPEAVDRFVAFWTALATQLASSDPGRTFFEVLNEPVLDDVARWREIQGRALAAMRRVAPRHTLIACGDRWSGRDRLNLLKPYDDPNIVYTFHTYDPFTFTHQGATWTSPELRPLRDLPYPSSPEGVAEAIKPLTDEGARGWAEQYGKERWDAAKIDEWIRTVAAWGREHGARVYCGEFGVMRHVKPEHRLAWLKDMADALGKHGIGWAVWEYAGGFGIAEGRPGVREADLDSMRALGMAPG